MVHPGGRPAPTTPRLGLVKTDVVDRPERHRFEILADGEVAGFSDYQLGPGEIMFIHTEIDDAYEGEGLGSVLVRHALDAAREQELAVLPLCPFVRGWISRHDDYLDLVPAWARRKYDLPAA
jgi:uncharacterized protein